MHKIHFWKLTMSDEAKIKDCVSNFDISPYKKIKLILMYEKYF